MRAIGGFALVGTLAAAHASAAPVKVAVADFDFVDTSGEVKDQAAAHATRLRELQQVVSDALTESGHFAGVGIGCAAPPCSADNMDAASLSAAGKKAGAHLMVFGGVHKISTLITFGRVDVVDLDTGRGVLNKSITFRGDSEDAWRHADSYIAQMVVEAAGAKKPGK